MKLINVCKLTLTASLSLAAVQTVSAEAVGEVVFAIGDAHIAGQAEPVKRGTVIEPGQTLTTGENGHIHIRFVDKAFVSLRPDSELQIQNYHYDPQNATNNQVQFSLQKGTSRLISGKAAQEAKQNFRLNTPVAAIGIRGTDFLVNVENDVTRVAVQQGAVVASAYSNNCSQTALGPCGGELARQLDGSLTGRYLEVHEKQLPELVVPNTQNLGKPFALPRPEEPSVGSQQSAALLPGSNGQASFAWGRWGSGAPVGFGYLGGNDIFVLYRAAGDPVLPTKGVFNFTPSDVQGYARSSDGALNPAQISNATLTVNFDNLKYATKFDWAASGTELSLTNSGHISRDGRFVANRNVSNVAISGGLSKDGNEAAYLFMKRLPGDDAYGVIHWVR